MGNEQSQAAGRASKEEEVAVVQAVMLGDVQAVQELLQQHLQLIYAHSKAGENLWHFAAQGGNVEVLKAVEAAVEGALAGQKKQDKLRAQVNHGFNQVNQAVNQVITSAVPLPAAMAIPMTKDISVNAQTRDGLTPLMAAVKAGKPDAVQQLLTAGAEAWLGDNGGTTALHHAAWLGDTACVEILLKHADGKEEEAGDGLIRLIDITTNTGLTALHYAAWRGKAGVVKQLVNAGAALAAPSSSDTMGQVAANAGSTPLHLAAMKGELGVIRLLLRANAKLMALSAADGNRATPPSAASGARGDIRRIPDKYGKTAGRLAWDMQRSDLAMILDVKTPLEQAIELAGAAAKAAPSSDGSKKHLNVSGTSTAQQPSGSSHSSSKRQPGDVTVDCAGQSIPAATSNNTSSNARAGAATGALHKLAISKPPSSPKRTIANSTMQAGNSGEAQIISNSSGGGVITLERPKARFAQQHQGDGSVAATAAADDPGSSVDKVQSNTPQQQQWQQQQQVAGAVKSTSDPVAVTAAGPEHGSNPLPEYICPITNELMKDPVRACDGVAYEREAIEVWFQLGNTMFPGGHARIANETLTEAAALQKRIAAWKQEHQQ